MENSILNIQGVSLDTNSKLYKVFELYCSIKDNKIYNYADKNDKDVKNNIWNMRDKQVKFEKVLSYLENNSLIEIEVELLKKFDETFNPQEVEKVDELDLLLNSKLDKLDKSINKNKKVDKVERVEKTIEKIHEKQSNISDFTNSEIDVKPKQRDTSILLDENELKELEEFEANKKLGNVEEKGIKEIFKLVKKGGK